MAESPITPAENQEFEQDDLCAMNCLFIAEYFRTNFNQRKSYKAIYGENLSDEVADAAASRLLRKVKVAEIVKKKKEEIVATAMIDAKWALNKRLELINRCTAIGDESSINSALTAIEKHHLGMAENKNVQIANKDGETIKVTVTSDVFKEAIKDLKDEF